MEITKKQKERNRCREKYHRLNYRGKQVISTENKKRNTENYCSKFPEKASAKKAVKRVRSTPGHQKHHWSYNEEHWRDTIELLILDHALLHRHIIYDQERMMYRLAKSGILLDTKESHVELLNEIKKWI